MNWFSEPKPNEIDEDWEIEPWDDHSWRRIVLILLLVTAYIVSPTILRKVTDHTKPEGECLIWKVGPQ